MGSNERERQFVIELNGRRQAEKEGFLYFWYQEEGFYGYQKEIKEF